MPTLLIVDDEPNVLHTFRKHLGREGLRVLTAETATEGIALAEAESPDAMILDVRLPDLSGLDAFERIHRVDPRLPVIVVTAYATTETAIDAMKRGAFEYLIKPVDIGQLREAVARAMEVSRLRHVPAVFDGAEAVQPADRIVGRSAAMQEVYKAIGRVAPEDVNVLVCGESGTGKELVARAIFHHSRRSEKPFLAINCAAIPESLLESELFGHERGAFTGADRRRIGKFEQAHGGTILLDELGDMPAATQSKVLRVLQDGRFERVGGNETLQTDVRVLAATNQDLEAKMAEGSFRCDLFYRLSGFSIGVPPLRERLDDLPMLVEHFLQHCRQEVRRPAAAFAPEALEILAAYEWPGNVRELASVVKYAVVHAVGEVVTADCLPDSCRRPPGDEDAHGLSEPERVQVAQYVRRLIQRAEPSLYRRICGEIDRVVVAEVLRHEGGNQVRASARLGMSRTTLRAKLDQLGFCDDGE